MAGLLGTLHSASSGMSVSQTSIQTTSHNINNMNTPGYTRQRVEQSANRPFSKPGINSYLGVGQVGTGVQATDIIRIRNTFYDFQFRSESHNYGKTSIEYDYYTSMENIFNEPSDTSISSSLNNFFNGWHELSKDPDSVGAKNIVIENAKYLANNLNKVYSKLDNLQEVLNNQTENILNDVNSMLTSLQEIEKNIKIVEATGKSPNDLLDQRDKILDDLSFKINLNDEEVKTILADGNLTLDEVRELKDIKGIDISGELSGSIKMNDEITNYKNNISELMNAISTGINEIYNDGLDPSYTLDLFKVETDINGNTIIKINEDITTDPSKLVMTSDKALEIYNFKDKKVAINGEDVTVNNFYNNTIQKLGHATQEVIRNEKNQSKLLLNIDNSRLSVSGVSMDEEMISLIQFQHAYNASAKVVSTIDSLLDVVINGLIR